MPFLADKMKKLTLFLTLFVLMPVPSLTLAQIETFYDNPNNISGVLYD